MCTLGILAYFLIYGIIYKSDVKSYFNCDKQLNKTEFGNSFAAASTSLATVLFFFITLGLENGLYILISPLSYLIGILLFNKTILPKLQKYDYANINKSNAISVGNTLGLFMGERYNSRLIRMMISFITIIGIVSILLIELYVGVDIFNIFIKTEYKEIALILISIVAFTYTGLGGLNTVVKTDKLQFWFMFIVASVIIIWLFMQKPTITIKDFFPTPMPLTKGLLLEWPLLFNMIFVNILLIPSMLRNWQLISATRDYSEVSKGLMRGFYLTATISALFIVLGILFFKIFPHTQVSLNGILISMASSEDFIVSYIFLPLLFMACLMALLSTVDSSLLPVVQSISTDFIKSNGGRKRYLQITFVMLIITLGLYWIVFKIMGFNLIEWLYTIFSLVTISSPAIILGCLGNENILRKKVIKMTVVFATIVGLFLALLISYIGNKMGNVWLIQLNTPVATLISSLWIVTTYKLKTHKQC